jgi:D-aminoacyl-tRNA deacylase
MIALLQRVSRAEVTVEGRSIAAIGAGLLAFIGVRPSDDALEGRRLIERLLAYRIFADDAGRMNLSLRDTRGALLLVPQFTLAAETRKGNRPGFSTAAPPQMARELFLQLVTQARACHDPVLAGEFAAHMQVSLVNDGPVTFWLESHAQA